MNKIAIYEEEGESWKVTFHDYLPHSMGVPIGVYAYHKERWYMVINIRLSNANGGWTSVKIENVPERLRLFNLVIN